MNEFRFADIGWLHAIWAVLLLLLVLLALEMRGQGQLQRMLSRLMQQRLVRKPSLTRRLCSIALFCGSLCCVVVALMRPQWGHTLQMQLQVNSQIMICLDVSKSMLAEDVVPNRLDRAKAEVDALLSLMNDGQQVGLMAFAGKASVLCPLTTDFGFLRLVLAETQPATVGLGGTRIGEAIQKAVDGFREAGDMNRMILLITDGEDHDSFPMDAAKQAKEKGVRIVSIGFGDENGSKIEITDPQTGVRNYVKDRNGADVVSRLDGETLRDIALETDGAYIPAGTGALDLQSIYDAHIASLLRGSATTEEQIVRQEGFQWLVLAAMLLLIISLAIRGVSSAQSASATAEASPSETRRVGAPQQAAVGLLCIGLAGAVATPAIAQSLPAVADSEQTPTTENASSAADIPDATGEDQQRTPRETYNMAARLVTTNPDRAQELLEAARSEAGTDGELRYRVLYNLGWVHVSRADQQIENEPSQALQQLQLALSRFREAVRVRPDSQEARHNLEIVSRRILELQDALSDKNPQELAQRLDELIQRLRGHQSELQSAVVRMPPTTSDIESYRTAYRQLGVNQRQIISDLEKLAADARQELTGLEKNAPDPSVPDAAAEQRLKLAQFTGMLRFVDRGLQRLSMARSFTRRMQGERAFVRWSAGLSDAKRARDQLRNPMEVLSVLVADATELVRLTQQRANPVGPVPAWLSTELLSETQIATTERVQELHDLLQAAYQTPGEESSTTPNPLDPAATELDPAQHQSTEEAKQLRENIGLALPALADAITAFTTAEQQIEQADFALAVESQRQGAEALKRAAEVFFDLRRLIEVTYRDELLVQGIVQQLASADWKKLNPPVQQPMESESISGPAGTTAEHAHQSLVEIVVSRQAENLQRAERIDTLLHQGLQAAQAQAAATANEQDPQTSASQSAGSADDSQRYEQALQLLAQAQTAMAEIAGKLADYQSSIRESQSELLPEENETEDATPHLSSDATVTERERPPSPARMRTFPQRSSPTFIDSDAELLPVEQLAQAVEDLEALRRLFFSVVEHLRETAQRQAELADETTELAGRPEQRTPPKLGALSLRQQSLEEIANQIAAALQEQAAATNAAATNAPSPAPPAAAPEVSQADSQRLSQAAELVSESGLAMQRAQAQLSQQASKLPAVGSAASDPATDSSTPESSNAESSNAESSNAEASTGPEGPANLASEVPETVEESPLQITIAEQQTALQRLLEALQLLDQQPPQDNSDPQQQPQSQEQQAEQPSEAAQGPTPEQQKMNAAQMLQLIREREAERRREKQPPVPASRSSLEKDW